MTRDREVIDSELRLLAAVRRTVAEEGGPAPDITVVDELLDERRLSEQGDADEKQDKVGSNGGA